MNEMNTVFVSVVNPMKNQRETDEKEKKKKQQKKLINDRNIARGKKGSDRVNGKNSIGISVSFDDVWRQLSDRFGAANQIFYVQRGFSMGQSTICAGMWLPWTNNFVYMHVVRARLAAANTIRHWNGEIQMLIWFVKCSAMAQSTQERNEMKIDQP